MRNRHICRHVREGERHSTETLMRILQRVLKFNQNWRSQVLGITEKPKTNNGIMKTEDS